MDMHRRLFLRGLGGAVVAAPFLASVAEKSAESAGLVASLAPRRLIIFFTHYGCVTDKWFPTTTHGRLTSADFVGKTTEPLAEFAPRMLVPRGLRAMNQWDPQGVLGQQNDPHTQGTGSLLTCHPVSPDGECAATPTNCIIPDSLEPKNEARPTGRSLDHIAAEQVNQGTDRSPLVLKIGGHQDSDTSEISYSAPLQPFEGHGAPDQIFANLTGLFGGGPMSPDSFLAARGKSVIDIVADDLAALKRVDMSQADRDKLDAWTELLHSAGTSMRHCSQEAATALGLSGPAIEDGLASADIMSPAVTELMLNLATLTALCDANRVIVVKFPPYFTFRGFEHDIDHHTLSHRMASPFGGECRSALDMLEEIDHFHAQKFAYLARTLDAFTEPGGSALDNSALVWLNELSDGIAHTMNNFPIIQIGSCGGTFKVGQAINLEDATDTMSQGNSSTECEYGMTELPRPDHPAGTPREIGNRPINKYYCNLLNALGVRANAEGFPELGGTHEVSRFGKFDDTTRFKGGLDAPAEIVDEGEFTELRA